MSEGKDTEKWILCTGLAILGVLTHQVYVFIYFPIAAAIYIYEFFQEPKKSNLKYGILLFGSCFLLALYLQLFSQVNCASAQEMYDRIVSRTVPGHVNLTVLQFEYFGKFSDHWNAFGQYMIVDCIKMGLAAVILLIPLWILFGSIWKGYIHRLDKTKKIGAYLMLVCNVAYIPIFIITVDWGRWFAALVIFEFLLILYLGVKDDAMKACLREKQKFIKENPIPFLLLLIYLASLGKFDAINVCSSSEKLVSFIGRWIKYLS